MRPPSSVPLATSPPRPLSPISVLLSCLELVSQSLTTSSLSLLSCCPSFPHHLLITVPWAWELRSWFYMTSHPLYQCPHALLDRCWCRESFPFLREILGLHWGSGSKKCHLFLRRERGPMNVIFRSGAFLSILTVAVSLTLRGSCFTLMLCASVNQILRGLAKTCQKIEILQ